MLALMLMVAMAAAGSPQREVAYSTAITKTVTLNHLLYLPPGYEADQDRPWPLIVFLHGSGERGTEIERVKTNGLPKRLDEGFDVAAIVISPQCPQEAAWTDVWIVEGVHALIGDALTRYRIDPQRVYLTGLSMGGRGTWALGIAQPERFAALAPVCGGGNPDLAYRLRRTPIWAFHGADDPVVPLQETQAMADALARYQGKMRLTIYPGTGHDSWIQAYDDPAFYTWLLDQVRTVPTLVPLERATLTASTGDPHLAADGNFGTRWESAWEDPQWLQIDLGESRPLRTLSIFWETAFGQAYDLLDSSDGRSWTTVHSTREGDGAGDRIEFPEGHRARYLKLDLKRRGTAWGYSIWEMELE